MQTAEPRQPNGRRLTGAQRDVLAAIRRLPPGAVTSEVALAADAGVSRSACARSIDVLVEAGIVGRRYVIEGGRVRGARLATSSESPSLVLDEVGDELDAALLEAVKDPKHPRRLHASMAYLLRHGADRGYVGIEPPRTLAEWETWTPEPATAAQVEG